MTQRSRIFFGIFVLTTTFSLGGVESQNSVPSFLMYPVSLTNDFLGNLWLSVDIHYVPENDHDEPRLSEAWLLRSADGGGAWHPVVFDLAGQRIEGVLFVDEKSGYAFGECSAAGYGSPFLLVTKDGGESWERVGRHDRGFDARFMELVIMTPGAGYAHVVLQVLDSDVGFTYEEVWFAIEDGGSRWVRLATKPGEEGLPRRKAEEKEVFSSSRRLVDGPHHKPRGSLRSTSRLSLLG